MREIVVRHEPGQDHSFFECVPRDGRADLGHVRVKNVVQHLRRATSFTSAGAATGKGFDQAQQVLVRAQAADVKQEAAARRKCRIGRALARRPDRSPEVRRPDRALR